MTYNVLDLFCGCGGLSSGFEEAGFNILLGVDNDDAALMTFKANHKNAQILSADLSEHKTFTLIKNIITSQEIDIIIGGPPCQGFSLSGPRNFDDSRNKLYFAMIETVKKFSPRAFLIENVPGMATLYKGAIKEEIIKRFTQMGYFVTSQIVCAADYGVPQLRKRLVIIGLKNKEYIFPKAEYSCQNYITCEEALSDLPSLTNSLGEENASYESTPLSCYQAKMRGEQTILYNHIATKHTQHVIDVISQVPEGGNYKDLPEGVGTSRKFNEAWTRYHSKKPSKTIDTGHRNHFHYKYNRVPTIRENARLQSFSDDFIFYGTKTQQNRQVGNAVPPLLAFALAKELLSHLNNEK